MTGPDGWSVARLDELYGDNRRYGEGEEHHQLTREQCEQPATKPLRSVSSGCEQSVSALSFDSVVDWQVGSGRVPLNEIAASPLLEPSLRPNPSGTALERPHSPGAPVGVSTSVSKGRLGVSNRVSACLFATSARPPASNRGKLLGVS